MLQLSAARPQACPCPFRSGWRPDSSPLVQLRKPKGGITQIDLFFSKLLLTCPQAGGFPNAKLGQVLLFCLLLTAYCFLLIAYCFSQLKPQSFAGHGEGKGGGNGFLQVFVDGMQLVIGMHGVVVGQQELLYTA